MGRIESQPTLKKETVLDKAKKFVLKILGIGALIGVGYIALKKLVIPYLGNQVDKLKKHLT
ncbi:unnamed protein product [marine sediment metagenome]|uniref:Uncharacterized protein n=1 Tax=marine sediment metagenome TaxID=412755 RepID=X0SJU2_9ZZZZ